MNGNYGNYGRNGSYGNRWEKWEQMGRMGAIGRMGTMGMMGEMGMMEPCGRRGQQHCYCMDNSFFAMRAEGHAGDGGHAGGRE